MSNPVQPEVGTVKVYAIVESVVKLKCSLDELNAYMKAGRFGGQTVVNYQQGGVTNIVTKEHISLTMEELDFILAKRQA